MVIDLNLGVGGLVVPVASPAWRPFRLLAAGPRRALLALLAFAVIYGCFVEDRGALIRTRHTDVGTYFSAAWAIRIGSDPYDARDRNGWHYTDPPLLAVLLTPLADAPPAMRRTGLLPYAVSVGVWYGLSVAFLFLAADRLARALIGAIARRQSITGRSPAGNDPARRWAWRWWTLVFWPLLLCLPAICRSVIRGQVGPLWLLLICLMVADVVERRPLRAGLWLAGAICVKVIPAFLLIYPLWRRDWRMLAGTATGLFLGLFAVPLLAMGPGDFARANVHFVDSYVRPALTGGRIDPAVEHERVDPRTSDTNAFVACLMNTGHLLFGTERPYTPPRFARVGHWVLGGLMTVATLAAAGFAAPRRGRDPINEAIFLGLLTVVMLPLAPVCPPHYFMLLAPLLMAVLATYLGPGGLPYVTPGWVGLLALVPASHLVTATPGFQSLRDLGLVTWAAVAVWAGVALRLRARTAGGTDHADGTGWSTTPPDHLPRRPRRDGVPTVTPSPASPPTVAPARTRARWTHLVAFVGLAGVLFVVQFARSVNRSADPDEHQFVAPGAMLAAHGRLPYVDYPYFHMPNLVFLVAALTGWTSWKLLAARTISAACGTATVAALFAAGWRAMPGLPPRLRWTLVGGPVLVFTTCRLFTYTSGAAWNHDTATLCMVLAFLAHVRGIRRGRVGLLALAGFLAGMALGIRLSFALAVVPLAASLWYGLWCGASPLSRRQRLAALLAAASAAAVANAPTLWLLSVAPRRVVFGNLGYPSLSTAYYRSIHQHGMTLPGKVGSSLSKFLTDPGNLALLLAFAAVTLGPLWAARARRARVPRKPWTGAYGGDFAGEFVLAGLVILALWVGAMGPTPMMQQYNYALVPFMLLAILYALATAARSDPARLRRVARVVAVASLVVGGSGLRWYWWVVRLPSPRLWTPVVQHEEGRWIRGLTGPDARVLTMESTVPLEAGLDVVPEYATGRFVLLTARFQPAEARRTDDMVGAAELASLLDRDPPDAVFARLPATVDAPFINYAQGHGYQRFTSPGGANQLWLRPGLRDGRPQS